MMIKKILFFLVIGADSSQTSKSLQNTKNTDYQPHNIWFNPLMMGKSWRPINVLVSFVAAGALVHTILNQQWLHTGKFPHKMVSFHLNTLQILNWFRQENNSVRVKKDMTFKRENFGLMIQLTYFFKLNI